MHPQVHYEISRQRQADLLREAHQKRPAALAAKKPAESGVLTRARSAGRGSPPTLAAPHTRNPSLPDGVLGDGRHASAASRLNDTDMTRLTPKEANR